MKTAGNPGAGYELFDPAESIGLVKAWYGQFGNILRAWT